MLSWGSRSYNVPSAYALGAGSFAQARFGLTGLDRQADILVGVQLNLAHRLLPWVLACEALTR